MKKVVVVIALAAILATGTAFADHPDGLGIGVVGGYGWGGFGGAAYGLSLKIPGVPIFWAVNLGVSSEHFRIGLTGDYYIIDQALVKDIGLHWFFGLGGFFDLYSYSKKHSAAGWSTDYSYTNMDFGLRVPIGLSWQPVKFLEIFLDVAPSLGVYVNGEQSYKLQNGDRYVSDKGGAGFFWGIPLEIGLRIWI